MSLFSHIKRYCCNFRRARSGTVAIETALLVPLAVVVVIAAWELYHYYRAVAVVDRTAFTIANSVAMQRKLLDLNQCKQADDICTYQTIAPDLMIPLDYQHDGNIVISFYTTVQDNNQNWYWDACKQYFYKGRDNPRVITLPSTPSEEDQGAFPPVSANDNMIAVAVFYHYTPFVLTSGFWQQLAGDRTLISRAFFRPRFIPSSNQKTLCAQQNGAL